MTDFPVGKRCAQPAGGRRGSTACLGRRLISGKRHCPEKVKSKQHIAEAKNLQLSVLSQVFFTSVAIPFFFLFFFQKLKLGPNLQPSRTQAATSEHPSVEGEASSPLNEKLCRGVGSAEEALPVCIRWSYILICSCPLEWFNPGT